MKKQKQESKKKKSEKDEMKLDDVATNALMGLIKMSDKTFEYFYNIVQREKFRRQLGIYSEELEKEIKERI